MADMFRYCPQCEAERPFAQYHAEPARCPDTPGGTCPEWFCADCGTVLMIGGILAASPRAVSAAPRARVA